MAAALMLDGVAAPNGASEAQALLVIDVQRAFCEGTDVVFDCPAIVGRINAVSSKARAAGIPVFLVQHESTSGDLQFESAPWQLAKDLLVGHTDVRIRKTTSDAFLRTSLESELRSLGVTSLIICGMFTEFCVDTTVRRALALGYPVTLITDAHTTTGNEFVSALTVIQHHNVTLTRIESFGVQVRPLTADSLSLAKTRTP